jgi:hypothetical protein
MPGVAEHLAQAAHNESLFLSLDHNVHSDWAVTVLFYAALQYVDAYLASIGIVDPGGHDVRDKLIQTTPALRPLWSRYKRLKSFSRTARYYAGRFSRSDINGLRLGSYEPLKADILRLLAPARPSAPGRPSSQSPGAS